MKAVFDAKSRSQYDDEISSRYHFPSRYHDQVSNAVGDWIVFRRPRDGGDGIAYFAVARVARIEPDPRVVGFHYAIIEDYLPFPREVEWRVDGRYAERWLRDLPEVSKVGLHLRGRSVRPLEADDFEEIVMSGMTPLFEEGNARRLWGEASPDGFAEESRSVRRIASLLTNRRVRDAAFRSQVLDAYEARCAFTRLRLVNGGGRAEVQAAHIVPVGEDGPDVVQNGLALSGTAHWLFDRHLVSVDTDYRLLVAHNRIPSELRSLLRPSMERLHLPRDPRLWPTERFMAYHRERFAAA